MGQLKENASDVQRLGLVREHGLPEVLESAAPCAVSLLAFLSALSSSPVTLPSSPLPAFLLFVVGKGIGELI